MSKPDDGQRAIGHATQATAAAVLGMRSPGSLRALTDAPRNHDRGRTYDLRLLVPWYIERRLAEHGDPIMQSGGNSPATERYREAKAALAELDLAERRKELLARSQVHGFMSSFAAVIRRANEALARQYGAGAQQLLNEALDDGQRLIDRWIEAVHAGKGCPTCERPYSEKCATCLVAETLDTDATK